MVDFEALCRLPCCGGALDGTFMAMKKPSDFGDTYFYNKKFIAFIVLACMDAIWLIEGAVENNGWKVLTERPSVRQTVVCCALHNMCGRHQCPFEPGWLPDESSYINTTPPKLQVTQ